MAHHPVRVRRPHGPRQGEGGPARHRQGGRADRGHAGMPDGRRPGPDHRPPPVEDRDLHRRRHPPGRGHPPLPVHRVPPGRAVGVQPPQRAPGGRAAPGRRGHPPAHRPRARDQAQPRRPGPVQRGGQEGDAVRITDVECHVLLDPDYDIGATSSAQDDIVVEIHTDEGISGVGETDVNPWMARAAIQAPGTHTMGQGLTEMLLGSDPMDVEGIWDRLYVGSAMNGRRGVVVNAIGAIDMALHDLRGKALGRPCHELLGGAVKDAVTPYASLQPEVSSFEAYRDSLVAWAIEARERGYGAAKLEVTLDGPYAHKGLLCPDHRTTEVVAAVRDAVGPEFTLMVDVGYAWDSPEAALATLRDWQPFGLFFV